MDEHPEPYRNWMRWVTENLGHDMRFAPVAAADASRGKARQAAEDEKLRWRPAGGSA